MKHRSIFVLILKCFYLFCKLLGLCPCHYNSRRKLFDWSKWEIIYSVFVWINFSYFYPMIGLKMMTHLNPLVVISFFYLSMVTITFIFAIQCWHAKKLAALMNETQILMEKLLPFCHSISKWQSIRYGIRFIYKTIVTSAIAQIGSINFCVILSKMMTGKVDYFMIFIISIAYFLQTLVPNMFYTFVLGTSMQFHQLNAEIQKIADEANLLTKNTRDHNSNERFHKLSLRLDYIASLHGKLTVHTKNVSKIFAWQLLIVITSFVAILLIEVNDDSFYLFFKRKPSNKHLIKL